MQQTWLFAIGCIVFGIAVAGFIISIGIGMEPMSRKE